MKTLTRSLCIGLAALLPVAAAMAQDIKERSIKFAFQNQKGHPQAEGAQKFADLVAQKSGNKIQVKLFPGGTLGGDLQTVSALQGGTVEMTVLNAGILASQVKAFEVFDFPFLFATPQEADAVVDGPFGKGLFDKLAEKNLIGLALLGAGLSQPHQQQAADQQGGRHRGPEDPRHPEPDLHRHVQRARRRAPRRCRSPSCIRRSSRRRSTARRTRSR